MTSNSIQLPIHPNIGLGPIRFGMARHTVRMMLGWPAKEFMKTPDSKVPTDDFRQFHFHIYYDDDLLCKGVEFFAESKATLDGHRLAGETYHQVSNLLCKFDPEPIVDDSVVTFEKLGIRLYVPDMDEEGPEAEVENVYLMKEGPLNKQDPSLDELKTVWDRMEISEEEAAIFYSDLAYEILKFKQEGISLLTKSLQDPKPEKQAAALEALLDSSLANEEKQRLIRERLNTDSIDMLGALLWGCIRSENFIIPLEQIHEWEEHENDWIAAVAMVYLSRAIPEQADSILKAALRSTSPKKREFACDEIDERRQELKEYVRPLLEDPDENVREAAQWCFPFYQETPNPTNPIPINKNKKERMPKSGTEF